MKWDMQCDHNCKADVALGKTDVKYEECYAGCKRTRKECEATCL